MKKIYSLFLSAAVALSASATVTLSSEMKPMQSFEPDLGISAVRNPSAKVTDVKPIATTTLKGAPSRADVIEWEDLGEGKFSDGWYLPQYGVPTAGFNWPVQVQKSKTGEIYKIIDPFHQPGYKKLFIDNEFEFPFTDAPFDIIIDCSNPDYVVFAYQQGFVAKGSAESKFGLTDTPVYLSTAATYLEAKGNTKDVITKNALNSTLKDGQITLKQCVFGYGNKTAAEAAYAFGKEPMDAYISLPGAKDYSLVGKTDECLTSNDLSFAVKSGADIATAKISFLTGDFYGATAGNFDFLEEKNLLIATPKTTGSFTVGVEGENGKATLFYAGYDAAGERVAMAVSHVLVDIDVPTGWKSLGKCSFTEDLIGNLYVDEQENPWGTTTYEVEVQENIATPGLYRIVAPYQTEAWPFVSRNDHSLEHKHYLQINATDPNKVYIPLSYIGFDAGYGHEYFVSANVADEDATVDDALWGKLVDNTITLPAESVVDASVLNPTPYKAGTGEFKLVLPANTGVIAVGADVDADAPVEYYNLQGVRVANPTAGQLVIRRQGTTVEKVVIK